MIERIAKRLDINSACVIGSTIFKKLFYENAKMSGRDKTIFINQIEKITLLYSFSPDTINLKPYRDEDREYDEIAVILVEVSRETGIQRIQDIIQLNIPYPLVLIFLSGNKLMLNVAHKRINKADESRNTVEKTVNSRWLDIDKMDLLDQQFVDSLYMNRLSFSNCYNFYSDIYNRVILYNLSKYTGDYEGLLGVNPEDAEKNLKKTTHFDSSIKELRSKMKKEEQLNRRIELNIKIKGNQKELENIINMLKR